MRVLQMLALLGRLLLFAVVGKAVLVAINAAGGYPEQWLQSVFPVLDAEPAAWLLAGIAGVCLYALEIKARSPARGTAPEPKLSEELLDLRVAWPQDHAQPIRGFPPER